MRRSLLSLLVLGLALGPARGDVKLPTIFGNDMVLQRDMPVPVWGTATAGEKVTVSLLDQKKTTTADKDGRWSVALDKLTAGGPHTLSVAGDKKTIELTGVLVGEVWVCSGQSNMAWRLSQSENAGKEAETADYPKIRLNTGKWTACTPKSALTFSACGYYFGRDLHKALNAPIGLVNRSVGGTSARRWIPQEVVDEDPALKPYAAAIKKGVAGKAGKGKPGDLYAGLIKPLLPFAIRGVIWYQGESDTGHADEYAVLFPAMIRSWRETWKQGDFPFLYVQLAPIGGRTGWELLREAQLKTLAVPKTGMAVIIDGDVGIHPVKKVLPGSRLALAARAIAYGEKIVYSGPIYKAMKADGDKVELTFDHAGGGLVAKGDKLTGFTVVDADGKSHPAEAKIDGDKVIVWSKDVNKPAAVRYSWANHPDGVLYNKEGLPASPFRTDGGTKHPSRAAE